MLNPPDLTCRKFHHGRTVFTIWMYFVLLTDWFPPSQLFSLLKLTALVPPAPPKKKQLPSKIARNNMISKRIRPVVFVWPSKSPCGVLYPDPPPEAPRRPRGGGATAVIKGDSDIGVNFQCRKCTYKMSIWNPKYNEANTQIYFNWNTRLRYTPGNCWKIGISISLCI